MRSLRWRPVRLLVAAVVGAPFCLVGLVLVCCRRVVLSSLSSFVEPYYFYLYIYIYIFSNDPVKELEFTYILIRRVRITLT